MEGNCLMSDFISILDLKVTAAKSKSKSKSKSIQIPTSWNRENSFKKPEVFQWKDTEKNGYGVRLNEFYSAVEEQEEIVNQIKKILEGPVIERRSFENPVEELMKQNRFENHPMHHVIGVFFKTQKEVTQFCTLLRQEGLPYRGNEETNNVRFLIFVSTCSFRRESTFSTFFMIQTILEVMI